MRVCLCLYMQNTDCCKICGTSVHCLRKLKIGRYAGSFMGTDVDGEIGELTSNSDLVRCVDFHANLLGNRTVYSLALDGVLENEISECQNSRTCIIIFRQKSMLFSVTQRKMNLRINVSTYIVLGLGTLRWVHS